MLKSGLKDYVISSRIRLARNLDDMPFPNRLKTEAAVKIMTEVGKGLEREGDFKLIPLSKLFQVEMLSMKERHLISSNLIRNEAKAGVVLSGDETVSIMLNEEDHIREQVILPGFDLARAYEICNKVDDIIADNVKLAYDSRYGYITSCPTNLGTGMRASVMMFLPALTINNTIASVVSIMSREMLTLRGVYGEGSNAEGYMYQLSNQYTLGLSEQEIIKNVEVYIKRAAEAEENAREVLFNDERINVTDKVSRAWGILTNAYCLSSKEFMDLIAYLKLGASLGVIKLNSPEELDKIIIECQPASLVLNAGKDLTAVERDIYRAEYVSNAVQKLKN